MFSGMLARTQLQAINKTSTHINIGKILGKYKMKLTSKTACYRLEYKTLDSAGNTAVNYKLDVSRDAQCYNKKAHTKCSLGFTGQLKVVILILR